MEAVPIVGMIGSFSTLIIIVVLFFRTRHRERLALIKYDKDARVFNSESRFGLKFGLLLLAAGLGLGVGSFIDYIFHSEPVGVFASMMICGGLALIYYHKMFSNNDGEDHGLI